MAILRNSKFAWLPIALMSLALFLAKADERAFAQSRGNQVGAAAAGLALGLIIGGVAGQAQNPPQQQGSSEGRSYRACASIYGPGSVNASSNPAKCVCQSGYTWTNDGGRRCVPRTAETPRQPVTRSVDPGKTAGYTKADVEKIQESLNLLGYDAGSVDGSMGQKTQQAIGKYQSDKKFEQTGQLSAAELQVLLADVVAKREAGRPPLQATSPSVPTAPTAGVDSGRSLPTPEIRPDIRVELAHWETVRNSKILGELEDYIVKYPNGEFTKLAVLRHDQVRSEMAREAEAKLPKKTDPGAPVSTGSIAQTGPKALPPIDEAVYPKARQRRADAVAVIIGNSAYRNGVPSVDFGTRDAEAMKAMAMRTLGLEAGNILFIKDATRGAMDEVFGTETNHKGKLWRLIDPDGRSDVYIFYSGHGVPGVNDVEGNFLLPVDGDPNHANLNGYPLSRLYKNLGQLQTRSTTVFLDACFSGQSPDASGTPLIKNASPVFISKATPSDSSKLNVFAAANEKQLSSWDPDAGHGMFTRYVLAGLAGEADEDKNKEITAKELHDFVNRQVKKAARRTHGREQESQFSGNATFVLSSF